MTAVWDSNVIEKQLFSFIFEILVILRMGQRIQLIACALTYRKYRSHRQNQNTRVYSHNTLVLKSSEMFIMRSNYLIMMFS